MYCNIYVSVIWDLVRLLFCLPSSAPKHPEDRSHLPKKSPDFNSTLFFLPEVLAAYTAGDRPRSQADSALLRGYKSEAGEFFIRVWDWLWKKPAPTGCKETWEAETGNKYRPPHSINHILLCNFTLIYTHVHWCTHKRTRWSGYTIKWLCEDMSVCQASKWDTSLVHKRNSFSWFLVS